MGVSDGRERLSNGWGAASREEVLENIRFITEYGHNEAFLSDVEVFKGLSPSEYQALMTHGGMDAYMFPYTKKLSENGKNEAFFLGFIPREDLLPN